MKILDTDHAAAILRGQLDLRQHARASEPIAVTAVTAGELWHGVHKSRRLEENAAQVGILLGAVDILPLDSRAAEIFGRLKAHLGLDGLHLGDLDIQIASIALDQGASLLTHNQKHFERVPGLALDDWLA